MEAYYQQAERTAGTTLTTSLNAALSNSAICTAFSNSSSAQSILSSKYATQMAALIADSSVYNTAFNNLMYKMKLKCYIFRNGVVTGLVGGSLSEDHSNDYSQSTTSTYLTLSCTGHRSHTSGGSRLYKYFSSKISMAGFKKLSAYTYGNDSGYCYYGLATHLNFSTSSSASTYDIAKQGLGSLSNYSISITSYQSSYYVKFGVFCPTDVQASKSINMYHIWLE